MNKKNNAELGILISKSREEKGLSQRKLAKEANMDVAEVSRIESGKRKKPNILFLKGIAETLDLSLVELMKLAGYNDIDITFGKDISSKRSKKDYENYIQDYERFYFDVLEDIEKRRKNALECKGIIFDLIDKIENPDFYKEKITDKEMLEKLKEVSRLMKPNLEKFDKTKLPKYDSALHKDNM